MDRGFDLTEVFKKSNPTGDKEKGATNPSAVKVQSRIGSRDANFQWEDLREVKKLTKLPLILKGILLITVFFSKISMSKRSRKKRIFITY